MPSYVIKPEPCGSAYGIAYTVYRIDEGRGAIKVGTFTRRACAESWIAGEGQWTTISGQTKTAGQPVLGSA